jgi:hypothetical protein
MLIYVRNDRTLDDSAPSFLVSIGQCPMALRLLFGSASNAQREKNASKTLNFVKNFAPLPSATSPSILAHCKVENDVRLILEALPRKAARQQAKCQARNAEYWWTALPVAD